MSDFPSDESETPRKRRVPFSWTMHFHDEMLDAKRVLTLEEHGMLQVLHDLYCRRLGILPDHPGFIAGQAVVDTRVWKRLRHSLIAKGFLEIEGENLICRLKQEAVRETIKRMADGAKGGLASGRARKNRSRASGWAVPVIGNLELSDT